MAFFKARPERVQRVSKLAPDQMDLYQQFQSALQGTGAGGAFGDAADYYRGLLSGQGAEDFEAPLKREFSEQILPDIAEQFAGLGSGALSGSGFATASTRAATDLAERLGSIRAGLRQQGAQGLAQLGQFGLSSFDEPIIRPREPGMFERLLTETAPQAVKGGMKIAASAYGVPMGGAA